MPVSNGEVLKAVAEFVLADGTIAQNVLHWIADFTGDQTDPDVLAAVAQYIEDLYDSVDTYIDSTATVNLATAHVVAWDPVEGEWVTDRLIGTTLPSVTFTSGVDPQPNQISPVLVANTARPKTRGRKFLLPFSDSSADASEWVSGVLTGLGTALNHYLADEVVAGANILSPGVPRSQVNDFLEFTDGLVNSIVGTQRRRKPGVGA